MDQKQRLVNAVAFFVKMQDFMLKSKRLTLSSNLAHEYAEALAKLANNKRIAKDIGSRGFPNPYTTEDALFFFDKNREEGDSFFDVDFLIFVGGKVAGAIGLSEIDWTDRKAHVGYWLGEEFWHMGYATEALGAVVDFARDELKLVRLYAKVLDYNMPSLRVLMKNGFNVEGYERKTFKMEEGYHSLFLVARIFD